MLAVRCAMSRRRLSAVVDVFAGPTFEREARRPIAALRSNACARDRRRCRCSSATDGGSVARTARWAACSCIRIAREPLRERCRGCRARDGCALRESPCAVLRADGDRPGGCGAARARPGERSLRISVDPPPLALRVGLARAGHRHPAESCARRVQRRRHDRRRFHLVARRSRHSSGRRGSSAAYSTVRLQPVRGPRRDAARGSSTPASCRGIGLLRVQVVLARRVEAILRRRPSTDRTAARRRRSARPRTCGSRSPRPSPWRARRRSPRCPARARADRARG